MVDMADVGLLMTMRGRIIGLLDNYFIEVGVEGECCRSLQCRFEVRRLMKLISW